MPPLGFVGFFVLLLATQGFCKPSKGVYDDYNGDVASEDYNEDYSSVAEEAEAQSSSKQEPQIKSKQISVRQPVGSNVMLPCLVVNADNNAVVWKKDNEFLYSDSNAITENSRISRLPNNTLVIEDARIEDSSDHYECSILVSDGEQRSITHRLLIEPARTTDQPAILVRVFPSERVKVVQGERLVLTCQANVEPAVEMKWFRESQRLPVADEVISGNQLVIAKVNRHHAGVYQCLADNRMPDPPLAAINVTVEHAPEIEVQSNLVHTGLGVESELVCAVHAVPRARVTWYKDQKEVQPKKNRIATRDGKLKHVLKIVRTTEHDLGEYTCRAVNEIGQDSKTITLTGAPSQATIYGGERTSDGNGLILKWRLQSYSPITQYTLRYRRKADQDWTVVEPPVTDGVGNQFTVEYPIAGLQPGSYEAILMSRNAFGWSPPSSPHAFLGEYRADGPESVQESSAAAIRPMGLITALLLVISPYVLTSQ